MKANKHTQHIPTATLEQARAKIDEATFGSQREKFKFALPPPQNHFAFRA